MIERMLLRGVRLRWSRPADYVPHRQDGRLVLSPISGAPMTVSAGPSILGPAIFGREQTGVPPPVGAMVPHRWLSCGLGAVTYLPCDGLDALVSAGADRLICVWEERGARYVSTFDGAHPGEGADAQATMRERLAGADAAFGFDPSGAASATLSLHEEAALRREGFGPAAALFAVVTPAGDAFTVTYLARTARAGSPGENIVLACRPAERLVGDALKDRLAQAGSTGERHLGR